MPKTLIGQFENRIAARKAVSELEESGLPPGEIRILGEPLGLENPGALRTAHVEFEVELTRELERIGATKSEIETYLKELRARGALVFKTTFDESPDALVRILNRGGAIDIAELVGGAPHLPSLVWQNMAPLHDGSDLSPLANGPGSLFRKRRQGVCLVGENTVGLIWIECQKQSPQGFDYS